MPIAYVLTMMASQELTIRNTDPQQKQLMRFLPVAFGAFPYHFPAGLFVYWVTSNVITFSQNLIIYHTAPKPADQRDAKTTSESPKFAAAEDASTESDDKPGGKLDVAPPASRKRAKKKARRKK